MKLLYISHAMSNHGNKIQLFDFISDNEIQIENYLEIQLSVLLYILL